MAHRFAVHDDLVLDANTHLLRSALAGILKLGENRMRVIAPEVGGGWSTARRPSSPISR
jgi:hypothetical protein